MTASPHPAEIDATKRCQHRHEAQPPQGPATCYKLLHCQTLSQSTPMRDQTRDMSIGRRYRRSYAKQLERTLSPLVTRRPDVHDHANSDKDDNGF